MPNSMIDVRQRIAYLERRRNGLWSAADRCASLARASGTTRERGEHRAALLATSVIARAQAQCLTVEIYALRAMVGAGTHDIDR
ncbi:hypothetical protein CA603_51600 [Paraburkholderia hospita]|nr:hypothetical protein CA603_51600 [Paraburkholderia hospita]